MAKTNRGALAARINQILPLVVDGLSAREIMRFITEKTTWGPISMRTLDNYIARARTIIIEQSQVEQRELYATSLARKQRLYARASVANQLKTALAVQNSIDRMHGDYASVREGDYSAVDEFLRLMKGEGTQSGESG